MDTVDVTLSWSSEGSAIPDDDDDVDEKDEDGGASKSESSTAGENENGLEGSVQAVVGICLVEKVVLSIRDDDNADDVDHDDDGETGAVGTGEGGSCRTLMGSAVTAGENGFGDTGAMVAVLVLLLRSVEVELIVAVGTGERR